MFSTHGGGQSGLIRSVIAFLTACAMAISSAMAWAKDDRPSEVRDLHYGVVLYYLYQDDFLNTITELQLARQQGRLSFHADEARLMEGGLLLSYGLYREAQRIYEQLLQGEDVSQEMRNRVWFELAKIAYQRGFYDDALKALNNMAGKVSVDLAGNLSAFALNTLALGRRVRCQAQSFTWKTLAQIPTCWSISVPKSLLPFGPLVSIRCPRGHRSASTMIRPMH